MYCDNCDKISFSTNTTVRITKDGREIIIEHCGSCRARVETEFRAIKGTTTRFTRKRKKPKKK